LARKVAGGLGLKNLPPKSAVAADVKEMAPSEALCLIEKYPPSLDGRVLALTDGADAKVVAKQKTAIEKAGATAKTIGEKIGGVTLSDGTLMQVDGQPKGSPSVLLAVAIIASPYGCKALMRKTAAMNFVADAFSNLKAFAHTSEAKTAAAFILAAMLRQWAREEKIHPPATIQN
jgi:catalase